MTMHFAHTPVALFAPLTTVAQQTPEHRASERPLPAPRGAAAAPTCTGGLSGTGCGAPGSWASPCPRRSSWAGWSGGGARRTPGPGRSRRACGRCTRWVRGQRTGAGPCGTCGGCSARWVRSRGCRWRCRRSAASCSCRSGCRPWRHPGSGCSWC